MSNNGELISRELPRGNDILSVSATNASEMSRNASPRDPNLFANNVR